MLCGCPVSVHGESVAGLLAVAVLAVAAFACGAMLTGPGASERGIAGDAFSLSNSLGGRSASACGGTLTSFHSDVCACGLKSGTGRISPVCLRAGTVDVAKRRARRIKITMAMARYVIVEAQFRFRTDSKGASLSLYGRGAVRRGAAFSPSDSMDPRCEMLPSRALWRRRGPS